MPVETFRALYLEESDESLSISCCDLPVSRLPAGDVTVAVEFSTVNYKDGMVLKGLGRLVREYPHVPGVNLAGRVVASSHAGVPVGSRVVATGYRLGEVRWGGYATRAQLNGDQMVLLPEGLSTRQAMAIGTAGFAAMQALIGLEKQGLTAGSGEVLVTGAAGGVGSIAVALLAHLGYSVAAVTGRVETHEYLKGLGAERILAREELSEPSGKPLESQVWAGCIDAVGGVTMARALAQLQTGASLAAIGLTGGNRADISLLPFLLRGVNLLGIDTPGCPMALRREVWARLAQDMPLERLEAMVTEVGLEEVPAMADQILAGKVRGRLVVDVNR